MSIITLQIGQCGSQIGESIYSNLHEDANEASPYRFQSLKAWFSITERGKSEPRSIVITDEHLQKSAPFSFKNVIAKPFGGSANNWAVGYSDRSRLVIEEILESTRKEAEKCDEIGSFLSLFSSAGGTGSGVGSFVNKKLREDFPKKLISSAVILPFVNGEIATQSYNTLLTLSKLYSINDSVLLFENDRFRYLCSNYLNSETSLSSINKLIAQQLLGVYQPISGASLSGIMGELCPQPEYRLLQVKSAPLLKEDSGTWKSLFGAVSRQARFDLQQKISCKVQLRPKFLATTLVCRGNPRPPEQELVPFKNPNLCQKLHIYNQPQKICNFDKFLAIIFNGNGVFVPLNSIVGDAQKLFNYGAYLHHYKKFGVDHDYFLNCFEKVENVLRDYKDL